MLPNIGLAGRAGSGKGVLAAELVKRGYEVVSFATALKYDVGRWLFSDIGGFELCMKHVNDNKAVLRPLLQAYGVAMRDLVGQDHWVNLALKEVRTLNNLSAPVVIDDVRFPNEVAALKAAGFVTVRIERPHWHRTLYGGNALTGEQATHSSEAQVDGLDVDHCLDNQTTPEALLRKLDYYLRGLND